MWHLGRLAAGFAAMVVSGALAEADAKPMPRERPAAAIPLARPQPPAMAASVQSLLPRPRPASVEADQATGSIRPDRRAARRHQREVRCLAKAIYFEARGEPIEGQFAVARVVLNRVADGSFPGTICGVVYQNSTKRHRCQFSFACDGQPDKPDDDTAWAMARGMAEALLRTEQPLLSRRVLRATHYHADYVAPWWAPKLRLAGQVGRHLFYVGPRREEARHASVAEPAAN